MFDGVLFLLLSSMSVIPVWHNVFCGLFLSNKLSLYFAYWRQTNSRDVCNSIIYNTIFYLKLWIFYKLKNYEITMGTRIIVGWQMHSQNWVNSGNNLLITPYFFSILILDSRFQNQLEMKLDLSLSLLVLL